MDPNNNQNPQPKPLAQPVAGPGQKPAEATTPAIKWQHGAGFVAEVPGADKAIPIADALTPPSPSTTPRYSDWQQPSEWTARGLPSTPVTSNGVALPSKRKTPVILIIIAVILAVLLVAVIVFVLFFKEKPKATDAAKKSSDTAAVTARDIATLNHATLNAPAVVGNLTLRAGSSDKLKDYVSADNSCEFVVGMASSAELPGADLNSIVAPQLQLLKKSGASVAGPDAGLALVIKQDTSASLYVMPTINYEFSVGAKHATSHYSASILSSGDRLIVNRVCANVSGEVDPVKLAALDDLAKQVTVTVKD